MDITDDQLCKRKRKFLKITFDPAADKKSLKYFPSFHFFFIYIFISSNNKTLNNAHLTNYHNCTQTTV